MNNQVYKWLCLCCGILCCTLLHAQLKVIKLNCSYRQRPLGIEAATPKLAWQLQSAERNTTQVAYQVLVSDDSIALAKGNANRWNSGKVMSDASIQIDYAGKPLLAAAKYYWKVRVWDNHGHAVWSNITYWQMGLLGSNDWQKAQWIGYEKLADSMIIVPAEHGNGKKSWGKRKDVLPLLRKGFSVRKRVKQATAFISGLGHFEMSINGKKVGDHFLDPGWTKYDKHALYVTFDIKPYLQSGANAMGILLGNGFYYQPSERYRKLTGAYGYPKMICRILIVYTDGTTQNIISDTTWKAAASPIVFSSLYGGEDYDARLEQTGWDKPGFNDATWKQAVVVSGHALQSQQAEPVKLLETLPGAKPAKINDSVWVYDIGQNMSGVPAITVKGKRGDTVKLLTAELLKADGTVNQKATGSPSYYTYILKGNGIETWQPRFSYYGFRYIQVEKAVAKDQPNKAGKPVILAVQGSHNRNATTTTGSFECSNELFNQTHALIDWAIKSNMQSIFTDCPHRERLGWQEEVHLMGNSIQYRYNIQALCHKVLNDISAGQEPGGLITSTVPEYTEMHFADGYFRDSPEWGSTGILLPWYLYEWYGDRAAIAYNYATMKRYLDYLSRKAKGYILSYGLSDWYDLGPQRPGFCQLTPMGLTATAYYYYDATIMEKAATLLHKDEDAAYYRTLAQQIKQAFNQQFFHEDTRQYGSGSQTSNAIALYMGLVDDEHKQAVLDNLIEDIRNRNYALTSGDIGFRYLLKVLDDAGRSDVIFEMNNRSNVPGYGYQLKQGATALTESWQALPTVSNNHLMLGHIMEWFYESVAGISQQKGSVGFKHIRIRPQVTTNVTYAKATYESVHGSIAIEWHQQKDAFMLDVTIPANTKATVELPMGKVYESNKLWDVKSLQTEHGKTCVTIGSGNYHFVVK